MTYKELLCLYSEGIQTHSYYQYALIKYGKSVIDVPIKSIPALIITEILNPFYLFQIFSICLWMYELYFYYAPCVIILSVMSIIMTLVDTIHNLKKIKRIAYISYPIIVKRPLENESDKFEFKTI